MTQNTFSKAAVLLCLTFLMLLGCKESPAPIVEIPEEQEPVVAVDSSKLQYVLGHFTPETDERFIQIEAKHASRAGMYMRKEAYTAYKEMSAAAAKEGIKMVIRSATRNFNYQRGIWERKWTGQTTLSDGTKASDIADPKKRALKILLYSSMPGTSRHHWGTDIDINAFNNDYFESGEGLKLYNWMLEHAESYGFCQPYTDKKDGRTGYEEEKWHWSYFPLSKDLTGTAKEHVTDDMIQGFKGAEAATQIGVVDKYVLGIDPSCPIE